jgi:hypothetical protein
MSGIWKYAKTRKTASAPNARARTDMTVS